MVRYDDHASDQVRNALLERARTEAIALSSDAGAPLISDPDFRIVTRARATEVVLRLCQAPVRQLPF